MSIEYSQELLSSVEALESARKIQDCWRSYKSALKAAASGGDGSAFSEYAEENGEIDLHSELLEECKYLLKERESRLKEDFIKQSMLAPVLEQTRGSDASRHKEQFKADADSRYWDGVRRLRLEKEDMEHRKTVLEAEVDENKELQQKQLDIVNKNEAVLRNYIRAKIAEGTNTVVCGVPSPMQATNPTSGALKSSGSEVAVRRRPIAKGLIEQLEQEGEEAQEMLSKARVEYIRLRNKQKQIEKREKASLAKEGGMHMIDFEQLKIENTNLNEKIEERNEEIIKLRKKATTAIHILSHVREKIEFTQNQNMVLQNQVAEKEKDLGELREMLNQSKKKRDRLHRMHANLKQQMAMVECEDLLTAYELRKHEIEQCKEIITDKASQNICLKTWAKSMRPVLKQMKTEVEEHAKK